MQNSSLNIPEWDGDPANLPVEGTLFSYKGQSYMWEKCNCGKCQRPQVFPAGTAKKDDGMTVRMRGVDNGHPALNVILKSGAVSVEELAQGFDNGSLIPVVTKVYKLISEHEEDREEWLEARKISGTEFWYFEHTQFS